MNKSKTMVLAPGDDVTIHVTIKCSKFTMLKIEAIEMNDPLNNEVDIEL